jgi:hypothetical protein
MFTFLIQGFLKVNRDEMFIEFCLIEKKTWQCYFLFIFCDICINLSTFSALKIGCNCCIRVKWIVMDDFEEIFPRKNVR